MGKEAAKKPAIIEIISTENIERSAEVIRLAFETVARDFGLTRENNSTHPSFITSAQLGELKTRGLHLFGLFQADLEVGFVAIDPDEKLKYILRNLAVLPVYRHCGYGEILVRFGLDYAAARKAQKVELSLINDNHVLKKWYMRLGFRETSLKNFPHLPFTVCFMEYDLR